MRLNLLPFGGRKVGSTTKIRAAGFSGIAGISWAGVARMTIAKSNAGKQCAGMKRRLKYTAALAT
jgi:hypothetical protein